MQEEYGAAGGDDDEEGDEEEEVYLTFSLYHRTLNKALKYLCFYTFFTINTGR